MLLLPAVFLAIDEINQDIHSLLCYPLRILHNQMQVAVNSAEDVSFLQEIRREHEPIYRCKINLLD